MAPRGSLETIYIIGNHFTFTAKSYLLYQGLDFSSRKET